MTKLIAGYMIFALVFAIIDLIWLGFVANNFYRNQLGPLMAENVNMGAAIAFYLLYVLGAMIFVVAPAFEAGSALRALAYGALFGFFCYMTYDLTNLAVFKGFPAIVAYVDIAWGATVTAVCSFLTVLIANAIFD